ncbi:MAG: hypothetical protein U9P79_06760 [Candidatus Cloacimonadota bacterium]|nr:hypothetical protein [Candidatus Cloacimonadota bacterium]
MIDIDYRVRPYESRNIALISIFKRGYQNMDIKEIRLKKEAFREEIEKMVVEFNKETGVNLVDIHLGYGTTVIFGEKREIIFCGATVDVDFK